ncbi:MAG: NADH-quinone oxidoreductase subunit L [Planctomycetota bacterium]
MLGLLEFDPNVDFGLLLAVPLIPLLGYAVQIAFRQRLAIGHWLLTGGMLASALITVYLAAKAIEARLAGEEFLWSSVDHGQYFSWLSTAAAPGDAHRDFVAGILYDPMGAAMLAAVGVISFCIHLFSIGYMKGDRRYHIFFANLSLFSFAMLGLVLADNLLFLFLCWEIMGLMSYLLIGHFSHDPSRPFFFRWAKWASTKAFLTTRIGDVCLLLGILMFYDHFHTLRFTALWEAARNAVAANGGEFPAWMTAAGLLVLAGTIGKSAQFPLQVWLPDAMAGPTPVSAMIHAATMVAAGVFLLGRTFPLLSPDALAVIAVVGAFTALFAATIGTTAYDLKAVLAWSTISQLGFMVAAVGLGAVTAGMFHMVTHAFFKACLFLSAGSVILGCHHVQDMRAMGGIRRTMPITASCMIVCTLAISGVPLFAGFYSKDMIIKAGFLGTGAGLGWASFALVALVAAALLTAFYMFRLVFLTFFGEYRGNRPDHRFAAVLAAEGYEGPDPREHAGHDAHGDHAPAGHDSPGAHDSPGGHLPKESPWVMTAALCILSFGAIFAGHFWLADPGHAEKPWFERIAGLEGMYGPEVAAWRETLLPVNLAAHGAAGAGHEAAAVAHDPEHAEHVAHLRAMGASLTVASLGIVLAWLLYHFRREIPARVVAALGPVYVLVRRRYYFDELYGATVIRGTRRLAVLLRAIDARLVDGLVNLVGQVNKLGGFFAAWFDRMFIDGAVNAVAFVSQGFGAAVRLIQTGRIQQYATFAMGGGLLAAAWLILG